MTETEKITINLSAVDLGRIDLLAEEGFYSNRTDFIRTAIRKELDVHNDVVKQSVVRRASMMGVAVFTRKGLERCQKKKEKLEINMVGGVYLSDDIPPALAIDTIKSLRVYGVLRASQAVKDALGERIL
ncbi:MAG TPA: CopG family transcriptional regulator [Candidatus Polarisedimenticolia bacterium]|nr:CopG family transcriptional regulator [Candidatus Polarisedimenticolia bacterium]